MSMVSGRIFDKHCPKGLVIDGLIISARLVWDWFDLPEPFKEKDDVLYLLFVSDITKAPLLINSVSKRKGAIYFAI